MSFRHTRAVTERRLPGVTGLSVDAIEVDHRWRYQAEKSGRLSIARRSRFEKDTSSANHSERERIGDFDAWNNGSGSRDVNGTAP